MKQLYLFRHAESVFNRDNAHLVGGRSNHAPLTETGEKQAVRLGHWIAARSLMPDVVYISPAVRTVETARISLEAAGIIHSPVLDDRLQELSQGFSEGLLRTQVYTDAVIARIGIESKDFRLDGGESMNDVALRKRAWAEEALAVEGHEHIFAYTHGFAIRCYVGDLLGWTHEEIRANDHANAHATIVTFADDGQLVDVAFNLSTQAAAA